MLKMLPLLLLLLLVVDSNLTALLDKVEDKIGQLLQVVDADNIAENVVV